MGYKYREHHEKSTEELRELRQEYIRDSQGQSGSEDQHTRNQIDRINQILDNRDKS